MTDLEIRIREHVEEQVPPIDIEQLVAHLAGQDTSAWHPDPGGAGRRLWWRSKWVAVATGAVSVVLLVGGVALLNRPTQSQTTHPPEPTTLPATTVPEALPSTTLLPVDGLGAGPWTSHEIRGDDLGALSVASSDNGFVAAGNTFTQGDVWGRGKIWTSDDGTYWRGVPNSDMALFEEGHFATDVVVAPAGTLVFGPNNRQGGTVVWHSTDGTEWTVVSTGDPPLDGEPYTHGITLQSGYLLYGAEPYCYLPSPRCTPADLPRIAVSADGISWEKISTPVTFSAITPLASGDLLAAGGLVEQPTTWISTDDGLTWQQHSADHSSPDQPAAEVWSLTETPLGVIALGLDADRHPTIWVSQDGAVFTPSFQLPRRSDDWEDSAHEIGDVAYGDGWLVAAGGTNGPQIWSSTDATTWHTARLDGTHVGGAGLDDIAYRDGAFVAVGSQRWEIGGEALVVRWTPIS